MNLWNNILSRRELIINLVARELKSRYKGSSLGLLWSVLTPLFMAFIYAFFFRFLVGRGAPTESIIVGVFAWQFTANCVNNGMTCITGNANLIKKVAFPRIILPLSVTLAGLVDYLISLVIQVVLVAVFLHMKGAALSFLVVLLPAVILFHAIFNFGLAMLMAALNVYFRDTQHLVGVLLSAFFFLSPAMYDLAFITNNAAMQSHPWIMNVYMLNPLAVLITGYRQLMLPGVSLPWNLYAVLGCIWPFLFVAGAYLVFRNMQKNFADYV